MKIDRVVYLIRNRHNGKRYVGISNYGTAHRWRGHVRDALKGGKCALQRAIRKYGESGFAIRVLERCASDGELKRREVFWIDKLDTYRHGYNQTLGGDGVHGLKWCSESKRKLAATVKAAMARPDVKRKLAAAMALPEYKRRHAAAVKVTWARPDVKRKLAAAIKAAWARPDVKRRYVVAIKAANKKKAQDPAWRAANKAANKKLSQDPAWRAACAAASPHDTRPNLDSPKMKRRLEKMAMGLCGRGECKRKRWSQHVMCKAHTLYYRERGRSARLRKEKS